MMEHRNPHANMEKAGTTGSRYRDVPSPTRTDGVGVALRRAFTPDGGIEDFSMLLQQLDRRTKS